MNKAEKNHIYVDHAATTPVHPEVLEVMLPFFHTHFGNPSSIHSYGQKTRAVLEEARRSIAQIVQTKKEHITFTSGGTESDNLALIGAAFAYQAKGKHIITSKIEHHAIIHACHYLERAGFEVTYLPVDQAGRVSSKDLEQAIRPDTILVSIMYGNNEVGSIQPITEIGHLLREREIVFHTDAVQAFGIEEIYLDQLPVDLLSVSSHKLNGPKGIGFLYTAPSIKIEPLFYGGAQERNRRAGTENLAAIVGFAKAIKISYHEMEEKRERYQSYKQKMIEVFADENIAFLLNGDEQQQQTLPHIINFSFDGVKSDILLMNLDLEGVAASSGSACSAGSLQPSHVLEAMYPEQEDRIKTSIRYSFGLGNTIEEVEQVARTTAKIIKRLRG